MSDPTETTKRRIFVGGLFPEVHSADLRDKFSSFGKVDEIEIKFRKDETGSPVKTFAYLNITGNKKDFDKCFSTFNRAKWKGSMLVLQNAKESFLTKLQKERVDANLPASPTAKDTPPTPHDPLGQVPGVTDFVMRGAVPGTPIPGEKNWVVGKYGRVMPIVHLKKSNKKKILRVDPSKLCHNLKKLKDTTDQDADVEVDSLTWNIEGQDKDITRKRKGEFDQTAHKSKSVRTGSKAQMVMEFLADRERRYAEVVKEANDFEIVQRDGAVKKNADVSKSSKTPLKQTATKSSMVSIVKNPANYNSSDSDRDSADTDEIIASVKSSTQKKSNIAHQASQSFLASHSGESSDSDSDSGDEESSSFVFIPGKRAAAKKVLSLSSASQSGKFEDNEKENIKSKGGNEEKCINRKAGKDKTKPKAKNKKLEVSDSSSGGEAESDSEDTDEFDFDEADVNGLEFNSEADFNGSASSDDSSSLETSGDDSDSAEHISNMKAKSASQQTGKKKIFTLPEFKGRAMLDEDTKVPITSIKSLSVSSSFKSSSTKAVAASSTSDDDSDDDDISSEDEENAKPSAKAVKTDSVLKDIKSSKNKQEKSDDSDDDSSEGMSSDNENMKPMFKTAKLNPDSKVLKASSKSQKVSIDSDSDDETSSDEDKTKKTNSDVKDLKSKLDRKKPVSSEDSSDEDTSSDEEDRTATKSLKSDPVSKSKTRPVGSKMEVDDSSNSADSDDTDEILASFRKTKKPSAQQADVSNTRSSRTPVPVSRKSGGSAMDEFSCGFVVNNDKIVYPDNESRSDSDDSDDDNIPVKKMKDSRQMKFDKIKESLKDGNELRETERRVKTSKEGKVTEKERGITTESMKKENKETKPERLSPLDKHVDDNRRRLETIKERSRELESKKALVQQALAQVDAGSRLNKKIVFDSDDDLEETGTGLVEEGIENTTQIEKKKSDVPKKKKQLSLFDSSGSENSDSDSSDEDRFRIRPQYEGEKGSKLMQLQSRFGNDERFRIDERFVESEDEDSGHKDVVVEEDGESERSRTLRILEGVVGREPVARLLKQESQRKTFKDTTALHFDPTIEEHSQFEIKPEAKEKVPKKKNKKKNKKDEEEVKVEEMPEVSKERSYEVTSVLQDAFKSREEKSSGFSLLAAFGKKDQESQMETDDATMQSIPRSSGMMNPWEDRFRVDSSDESMTSEDEAETRQSSEKTKSTEKEVLFPAKKSTFFFTDDDDRLDEGVTFFRRPDDFEAVTERWRENRPKLVESYKEKLRKAVKNRRKLQLQKTLLRRNAQRGAGRRRQEES